MRQTMIDAAPVLAPLIVAAATGFALGFLNL